MHIVTISDLCIGKLVGKNFLPSSELMVYTPSINELIKLMLAVALDCCCSAMLFAVIAAIPGQQIPTPRAHLAGLPNESMYLS